MKKPRAIHGHHTVYPSPEHPEQELIHCVYAGEHEILGKAALYSRKTISQGFLDSLEFFVLKNRRRAVDLGEELARRANGKLARANKKLLSIDLGALAKKEGR